MITTIQGSIHQGHEAFSEHSRGRQCAFMSLAALLFNRSNSVDLWTQTNNDDSLCHGDHMYLHALTNKMVPDTNTLSVALIAVTTQSNCSYAKYLVYLTFALDRQKVLSIIVLIIRRCVSQCYSLYLLFSLTDIFVVNFSNYYNYIYSQRICNLCK